MEASEFPARITIREIAKALGLSRAAISLGLRNSPELAQATCRRIQTAALKMGYQPNLSASNLARCRRSDSVKTVHAAIAWLNCWKDPAQLRAYRQFDLYWQSAHTTAEAAGYRLEEFVVQPQTSLSRLQKILFTRNIYGIIIPPHGKISHWTKVGDGNFDWSRFSSVRIGHSIRKPAVPVVAPDQVGNAMLAVQKITELGYRRVGFVAMRDIRQTVQNWFLGGYFLAQIAMPDSQQIPILYLDNKDPSNNLHLLAAWLKQHRPDALLTELSDIRTTVEALGIRVPQDIGLATLNTLDGNIDAGIYQNPELIGKTAAEVLISLINRNERGASPDYRTTTVMGRWVDGPTMPRRT